MFRFEKALKREERYNKHKRDNPSFSSSLLDQICRSIDDNDGIAAGDSKTEGFKSNRETMQKKQIKGSSMERKVFEQANVDKKQVFKEFKRTSHHHDRNHDRIFFSSSSSSSDSSSGGFSSSDTESIYGTRTKAPCLVPPPRPKPVRTSVSAPPQKPLFWEQRNFPTMFDDHAPKSVASLKKVKQPISPGARIANFINSLFSTTSNNNPKKTKNPSSSFARSRLSKNPPSTREEELRDGAKRTVRFCPVSVIVEEDSKPCRQGSRLLPVSVPMGWKIGKSPSKKCDGVMEKSKRVEEIAREFLKGYHQNQKSNSRYVVAKLDEEDEVDDDDDAGSDSSSDLFELDHLVLMGDDRYREELPVYETTHVETNRAIANGFMVCN